MITKDKKVWCCVECGHMESKWAGQCFSCGAWNTMVEEIAPRERRDSRSWKNDSKPLRLTEIRHEETSRFPTHIGELDRLLGGGLVQGSLVLVGGDPGIGKSTLLLQTAAKLAKGHTVLYVTGEESPEQVLMRAKRLGIHEENLFLFSETALEEIVRQVEELKPDVLIVDSIQVVYKSEIPSAPGSLSQVRDVASDLMRLAKTRKMATFLIGHVTKSGEIAGPRVLEHLVDVVLYFEGDKNLNYRLIRAVKNRFGATDELAVFQMREEGLVEVNNPSGLFLQERTTSSSGSVIIPTLEGSRPFLLEVQALVTQTIFSTPSRRSTGIDGNRLALLLAVLEKQVGFLFHNRDVFVSLAGGFRTSEPAVDLGILLALISSFTNKPVDPACVVVGEVGLGGEVRSVLRLESRLKEAIGMGFKKALIPKKSLKGLSQSFTKKIELCGVDFVDEAIEELLP